VQRLARHALPSVQSTTTLYAGNALRLAVFARKNAAKMPGRNKRIFRHSFSKKQDLNPVQKINPLPYGR